MKLLTALSNQSRTRICVNTVIIKQNFGHLNDILRLTFENGVKYHLVSNMAPEGRGYAEYEKKTTRLSEWKEFFIKEENLPEERIRFFGLPLCVFGKRLLLSNDLYWMPKLTVEKRGRKETQHIVEILTEKPSRKRVKVDRCRGCTVESLCGGIFDEYFKNFGDEEIIPFKVVPVQLTEYGIGVRL